ncbi:MAG: hypothetical protein K0S32_3624 [Bacteroidetes bacterium]|jgi:hypothetical protein|nr:hypothetical protein [Bacteroidota bacterium]
MKNSAYFLTVLFFFLSCFLNAQNNHYVITIQTDSIPTKIKAVYDTKIVCEIDGAAQIFNAKDVLRYSAGGSVNESICVGGVLKKWLFVERSISGPLTLFVFTEKKETSRPPEIKYFVRKFNEPRQTAHELGSDWKKTLQELCNDCEEISQKLFDDKNAFDPERIVNVYNQKCPL